MKPTTNTKQKLSLNLPEDMVKRVKIEVIERGKGVTEASIVQEALELYWAAAEPPTAKTIHDDPLNLTALAPPQPAPPTGSEPEPIDPEQLNMIRLLSDSKGNGLGSRVFFFSELTDRCGEQVMVNEFFRWREQSRIPEHLLPHVRALIEEKRQPKKSMKL